MSTQGWPTWLEDVAGTTWASAWPNQIATLPQNAMLAKLRGGILTNMQSPTTSSPNIGSSTSPLCWWANELIDGISAGLLSATSSSNAASALTNYQQARDNQAPANHSIAFDPFQTRTILLVGGPRRSDDNGITWYLSDQGANGLEARRVRTDPVSGNTFAAMFDWSFLEFGDDLSTIRYNRHLNQVSYGSGFAFRGAYSFMSINPETGADTQIIGQLTGGTVFSSLLDIPNSLQYSVSVPLVKDIAVGTDATGKLKVLALMTGNMQGIQRCTK
jgi:hypothetical protein